MIYKLKLKRDGKEYAMQSVAGAKVLCWKTLGVQGNERSVVWQKPHENGGVGKR